MRRKIYIRAVRRCMCMYVCDYVVMYVCVDVKEYTYIHTHARGKESV
jgi:hypothetical protein